MAHLGKVMVPERGHESSNPSHAAILKRKSNGRVGPSGECFLHAGVPTVRFNMEDYLSGAQH